MMTEVRIRPSESIRSNKGMRGFGESGASSWEQAGLGGFYLSTPNPQHPPPCKRLTQHLNGAREEALKTVCFLELFPSKFSFTERFL